jgi:GAF domain-containing protein
VLAAVAEETRRLLRTDYATMGRYDPAGTITVVATWSSTGAAFPVGTRWSLGGQNISTLVFQTRRPTRIDDHTGGSGTLAEAGHEFGIGAAVGVPVSVEGRLWGVMAVALRAGPMPAGAERQLAGFTELAATAIANAEAHEALTASRARIVATADAARRRLGGAPVQGEGACVSLKRPSSQRELVGGELSAGKAVVVVQNQAQT